MVQNKQIRDKIDDLRRERVVFEQVYLKLEKELGVKRRDLARMIESVDSVNADRDQAINQIQALQAENEATQQREDDGAKVEEIDGFDSQEAYIAKKAVRKSQTPMQRLQNALTGQQGGVNLSTNEMVRKFVAQEEQHFSLFNTVSQLKTEVGNYEHDILDMQGQLEKLGAELDEDGQIDSFKAKAKRELDEKTDALEAEKQRVTEEIAAIE